MSQRGREGKWIWRERQDGFGQQIGDQITAQSTERMLAWAAGGRAPWWIWVKRWIRVTPWIRVTRWIRVKWCIRVKAQLRGRRIDVRPGGETR